MLGKDLYKIENNIDLSFDELKSLVLFYAPLIDSLSLHIYLELVFEPITPGYKELRELLSILNINVDDFEKSLKKLNKYKLVKTLKKRNTNEYIFEVIKPLNTIDFANNDILQRVFIKNVGGEHFQSLLSMLRLPNNYEGFEDVSTRLEPDALHNWTKDDEAYVKPIKNQLYKIDSFFDINEFLKGVSLHLLPMKYRTYDNLKAIATLADLYNISYEKMKTYLPKVAQSKSETFDIKMLEMLCIRSQAEYHTVNSGEYNVPCLLFLMNLQDGKDVTAFDRKIIYNLSNEYHLKPSVINVLLEYALKKSDNRLIENYIYSLASDLHRNNIENVEEAIKRLDKHKTNKSAINKNIKYDDNKNDDVDLKELEVFRKNG